MKRFATFVLLLAATSISAAQCPAACQAKITALTNQVNALQTQLAGMPVATQFDLTIGGQKIATRDLSKVILINLTTPDGKQNATILPVGVGESPSLANLPKPQAYFASSNPQNPIQLRYDGKQLALFGETGFTVHCYVLSRP